MRGTAGFGKGARTHGLALTLALALVLAGQTHGQKAKDEKDDKEDKEDKEEPCGHRSETDSRGFSCSAYASSPEHCGCCDTSSFSAEDCCECRVTVEGNATWWAEVLDTWPREATGLLLPEKGITGRLIDILPSDIAVRWPHLLEIDFWDNQLTGSVPPQLGSLKNLTKLRLDSNLLSGSIPAELGGLTSLEELRLNYNQLTGGLPPQLGNLSQLTILLLDDNKLTGPLPRELGQLSHIEELNLMNNELNGTLPPELGNMSSLELLVLNDNRFSGSLPPELGNLANLETLLASHNHFSGSLPPEIGNLTRLSSLSLSASGLSGSLPPELGHLARLRRLYLDHNQLAGSLPPELGDLSQLEDLSLAANQLSGRLPPELGKLTNLVELRLNDNQFSGDLPYELGHLTALEGLWLSNNQLQGSLPRQLGNLSKLQFLWLQTNNFTGALPPELCNLTSLEELWLSSNRFSGHLPPELGNLRMLQWLRLQNNNFTGGLPPSLDQMQALESFEASGNPGLCGDATVLQRLANLQSLQLAGCCFRDEDLPDLPPGLEHLDLTGNRFSTIPSNWNSADHPLVTLLMSANRLTGWDTSGTVPLSQLSGEEWVCGYTPSGVRLAFERLERLELSSNPLNVPVYEFLESLSNLQELELLRASDANLTGHVPLLASDPDKLVPNLVNTGDCVADNSPERGRGSFPALLTLDLSGNALTAVSATPPNRLMQADLSRNALTNLNPAWWNGGDDGSLQSVNCRANPGLQLPVLLDAGGSCPDEGTLVLTANDDGWRNTSQTAECTGMCVMERTRFLADASINESVLCRCSKGQGVGLDCGPCADNTYSSLFVKDGRYTRTCIPCPAESSLQGGQGMCLTDCTCSAGHFMAHFRDGTTVEVGTTPCSDLTFEGRCLSCGLFRTSPPGSRKSTDCFCNGNVSSGGWEELLERSGQCACPEGFYINFAERRCAQCQMEEDCEDWTRSLEPPRVKPGFWAQAPPPRDADGTFGNFSRHYIWRCQSAAACLGDDACGMNLTGIACGLCEQGHFRTGSGNCSPCPRPHREARWMLALFLLASSIFPLMAHVTLSANQESRGLFMTLRSFRTSLRQLLKFGQVLGLVSLLRVEWPPLVLSVFSAFRAFSLDFASWTGVACLDSQQQQSVTMELAFRWLLPVAGIVVTCLTALVVTLCKVVGSRVLAPCCACCSRPGRGPLFKVKAKPRLGRLRRLVQVPSFRPLDVLRVLVFFLHLLFPSLLQNSLLPLTCSPSPNGLLTMNAYPQLSCWSSGTEDDSTIFWPLAVAGLVQSGLLSLGFPLVLYFAWRSVDASSAFSHERHPDASSDALAIIEERRRWWVFVFEDFRPHKTFWPLEALGKDILLNLVVVLLPGFGTAQLLLTSFISLTYACRAFNISPYNDLSNTLLETCTAASIAVLCIFSAGMGFQSEPDVLDLGYYVAGGREGPGYLQRAITLVFLQGLSLVGPMAILTFQLLMAFPRSRRLIPDRLKPLSEEERARWSETFSAAMELEAGPLRHALSELDHQDFCVFMRTVHTAPMTRRRTSRFGTLTSQSSSKGRNSSCSEELCSVSSADPEVIPAPDEIAALHKRIAELAAENAELHAENAELQVGLRHSEQETASLRLVIAARNTSAKAPKQPPCPRLPDPEVVPPPVAEAGQGKLVPAASRTDMDKLVL